MNSKVVDFLNCVNGRRMAVAEWDFNCNFAK
jgi:hypothetical protein